MQVHREAHGQVAEKIIQVEPEVADLFLGGSEVNAEGAVLLPGGAADARDPGIRTVLFTDIVDSTSLTQKLGDEMAMEFLRVHDRIVRDALAAAKGREVKHTGDGIMASFVSAAAAVRCAVQIQRELARREREEQRSSHQSSHWRRGRGTGRTKQRYFWNDCATGGAALFPRRTRPNPGIDRGSGTMYREGLIISSFGRSRAQRF